MSQEWIVLVGTDGTDATEKDLAGFHGYGPMSYGDASIFSAKVEKTLAEMRQLPAFREPYGVITTDIVAVSTAPAPQKALENWFTLEGEED